MATTIDRIIAKMYAEIREKAIADFVACPEAQAAMKTPGSYVNTGPGHMPAGLADRKAHDARLAERGERDES